MRGAMPIRRRAFAPAGRIARLLSLAWFALLLAPLAVVLPEINAWEATRWQAALASVWIALFAWIVLPRKPALVATFPIVFAGLALVAADALRGADLLELLSVRYTFRAEEIADALRPYILPSALAAAALLCVAVVLWRAPTRRSAAATAAAAALSLVGLALALLLPSGGWRNAWPAVLAGAIAEGHMGDAGIGLPATADVRLSPRDRAASWHASRAGEAAAGGETYVVVIGESVRAERLPACGGGPRVSPGPLDAVGC
jgi:glucan phosphoethanolaminetransferase (alkaline phosphatase superfamily)